MRDLIVTENISLDGVIDLAGGWFDPTGGDDAADIAEAIRAQSAASDALLVGRVTFEQLRGFWPSFEEDTTGVREHLNAVAKYVVSGTIDDPGWDRTTVLSGDPLEEVRALKERPGRDIVLTGSIRLVHALMPAGLVDEYRLFVYPVVAGRGAPLFDGGEAGVPTLRLAEARPFRSGVVLLRYRTGA